MTVHARQLARLCRERLAARKDLPTMRQQPQQQHAAVETAVEPTSGTAVSTEQTEQPAR
ncbi:hypothetical protein [Actinophytocola sp.]|uniref:hypothetical protein n=1 Tax=Actinophytocola sp. TaxID=1872138 RepID=UPI0025BF3657|nr:hypothetical protein [Actinophytocola sp.]